MVGNHDAKLALLELPEGQAPLQGGSRYQKGHVAFEVSNEEFWKFKTALADLLLKNQVEGQSLEIIEEDYGIQKSVFFWDPDGNELEVTTWVNQ